MEPLTESSHLLPIGAEDSRGKAIPSASSTTPRTHLFNKRIVLSLTTLCLVFAVCVLAQVGFSKKTPNLQATAQIKLVAIEADDIIKISPNVDHTLLGDDGEEAVKFHDFIIQNEYTQENGLPGRDYPCSYSVCLCFFFILLTGSLVCRAPSIFTACLQEASRGARLRVEDSHWRRGAGGYPGGCPG
ncbi:unnamed protein product [Heterosigma akashiwo]